MMVHFHARPILSATLYYVRKIIQTTYLRFKYFFRIKTTIRIFSVLKFLKRNKNYRATYIQLELHNILIDFEFTSVAARG